MSKELTAMQMLIEELYILKGKGYGADSAINIAKTLLQKEQEQIEKAFDLGVQSGMTKGYQNVGKDYYQSKYGGENVDR